MKIKTSSKYYWTSIVILLVNVYFLFRKVLPVKFTSPDLFYCTICIWTLLYGVISTVLYIHYKNKENK